MSDIGYGVNHDPFDSIDPEELADVDFANAFDEMQARVHKVNADNGFWDTERNEGEIIALIHSELSEALEALRKGNEADDKIPEFSGVEAELADVIIRVMDYAEGFDYSVADAIVTKLHMNKTRAHKHGKAF